MHELKECVKASVVLNQYKNYLQKSGMTTFISGKVAAADHECSTKV